MNLQAFIAAAREAGASDLHLEPGLPAAVRIRGTLRTVGESVPANALLEIAKELIGSSQWPVFLERRSFDLSRTLHGIRCRINILQTSRGVGLAIRLLSSFQASIENLNLHPDLKRFLGHTTGLLLVSGPTGSGKSSTLAALIQEINLAETRHVVTIESPIEYTFRPRRAYLRQREVGRDTPSFEQALLDALREDPDVLMVGEMRDPETMRLTLNAAETGHLVLSTVHSSTCVEALQRIVSAFPAEIQNNVAAQLADCLVGVVCQRLQFRPDLNIRVPECEILVPTHPVKHFIRSREFFKIVSVIETGADHGMWTFQRYRTWLERRSNWHIPSRSQVLGEDVPDDGIPAVLTPIKATLEPEPASAPAASPSPSSAQAKEGRIEIEPVEGGWDELLRQLK
ncbi:MAG: PilT/PilU family type 4a pilus ATPase [Verrucomicrobia bacterium]|nr:PilT/PilU family type 4a pilus ATPase [Verrucomicrobiota bacterium]